MSLVLPNNLDFFSTSSVSFAFNQIYDESLLSITPLDTQSVLEFLINGQKNLARSLTDLYLHMKLQILKADGTEYKTSEKQPRLLNNILSSLFRSAILSVNNKIVYQCENLYHIKQYIECVLNYSSHTALSQGACSGFYPIENIDKFEKIYANSAIFDVYGRINLLNTHKLLLTNVPFSVKLEFNDKKIYLLENVSSEKTNSQLKISDVKLYVKTYELKESLSKQIEMRLQSIPAVYDHKSVKIVYVNIAKGSTSYQSNNVYNGIHPEFLVGALIPNSAFNGNGESNTFEFQHYNTKEFAFFVNNKPHPQNPYRFTTGKCYARLLSDIYTSLNLRQVNKSIIVNRENIDKLFLFTQDVSSSAHAMSNIRSEIQSSNVGFSIIFSEALEQTLTFVLYLLIPSSFSINKDRNVSINY